MFMFICRLSQKKKKKKEVSTIEININIILFINGTRAQYTRVLCCMELEFTKLEYHIIFLITQISAQQCHGGRTEEELEFLKLNFQISGRSPFIQMGNIESDINI